MPYKVYEQLETVSKQMDCPVAEVIRQAINLLLEKFNTTKRGGAK